jgi:hypothetical protein
LADRVKTPKHNLSLATLVRPSISEVRGAFRASFDPAPPPASRSRTFPLATASKRTCIVIAPGPRAHSRSRRLGSWLASTPSTRHHERRQRHEGQGRLTARYRSDGLLGPSAAPRVIAGRDSGARGLAARVLRPVLTSLGPRCAIRARPTAIILKKLKSSSGESGTGNAGLE